MCSQSPSLNWEWCWECTLHYIPISDKRNKQNKFHVKKTHTHKRSSPICVWCFLLSNDVWFVTVQFHYIHHFILYCVIVFRSSWNQNQFLCGHFSFEFYCFGWVKWFRELTWRIDPMTIPFETSIFIIFVWSSKSKIGALCYRNCISRKLVVCLCVSTGAKSE